MKSGPEDTKIDMEDPRQSARLAALAGPLLAACDGAVAQRPLGATDWNAARTNMVDEQIVARDIKSPRVLDAMRKVPRHEFVPESCAASAYEDTPLPIGYDQTISQPYIVAYMSEALELEPSHRVLEIGTGSGYQAAILGELAKDVFTIEIVAPSGCRARGRRWRDWATRTCTSAPATAISAGPRRRRSIA